MEIQLTDSCQRQTGSVGLQRLGTAGATEDEEGRDADGPLTTAAAEQAELKQTPWRE